MRKPKLTVPKSNPDVTPNLDPKAAQIPVSGWSVEDRARLLLDIWNEHDKNGRPWQYSEFVKKTFPINGTHDFIEGFLLASLFYGEAISGGYVREHISSRDSFDDLDGLMLQRFLDWVEQAEK